jgi:hypothetical protein
LKTRTNHGNGSGRVGDGHHRSAIIGRYVIPATAARHLKNTLTERG